MFKEFNLIGTRGAQQRMNGSLKSFNDMLIDINEALLHDSFDPTTNETYVYGAQYEAYEVFADAWVHSRHAKFVSLAVRGVDNFNWTTHLRRHPEWAHPKNAYMKGLIDCKLWLMCDVNARDSLTLPSGKRIALDAFTLKHASDGLLEIMNNRSRGPRQLLHPDNAYLKGCLDSSTRFHGREKVAALVALPKETTTWPGGGPC